MICVECGREADVIDGSCASCFVKRTPLLAGRDVVDLELCAHCDSRHIGAHWVDPGEGSPLEFLREEAVRGAVQVHREVADVDVQTTETQRDERTFEFMVSLQGRIGQTAVADTKNVLLRQRRATCDRCSRMFGGFYAAILQLRATDRDLTEAEIDRAHRLMGQELDRLRSAGNREAFLTKSERVTGGYDYYLGDIEGGRAISRVILDAFGAQMTEHAKLVGRTEGRDVYRVTFRIRIRLFAPGDFAVVGDEVVQVLSLDRGRAHVRRLRDHGTDKVDLEGLRRLGGNEIVQEAILVSRQGDHVQVLDPVDMRAVDLKAPPGWQPPEVEGVAWVLRHEDVLYLSSVGPPPPKRRKGRAGPNKP